MGRIRLPEDAHFRRIVRANEGRASVDSASHRAKAVNDVADAARLTAELLRQCRAWIRRTSL